MAAPPSQVLALRLDSAMGKDVSGDLAVLLLILANSCSTVAEDENFSKIQRYVTSFLFDEGRQALRVLLSMQGKDADIQHSVNQMVNTFPLTRKFGDADILFQFRPNKLPGTGADTNELRVGVGVVGFGPLDVIAQKMRRLISIATDAGAAVAYPRGMAKAVLETMLQVFPNGHQFLADLFDMETFEFEFHPTGGSTGDAMMVELDAECNIARLDALYPAVANWLRHVQELDFAALEMHAKGSAPEADLESAPCFFKVRLEYSSGLVTVHLRFLLVCAPGSDRGELGWFECGSEQVIATAENNKQTRRVDFDESKPGSVSQFRLVLRDTVRLHELGCGSFALPVVVLQLSIKSSAQRFPHLYEREVGAQHSPAHRLEVRILHVGEKRLTSMFVRPFFNLNAFRDLLLSDFCVEIDVVPNTKDKHDFFIVGGGDLEERFEIVPGHWSMVIRLKMLIVPASGVLVRFFRMFASVQLANPDDLRFWWQLSSALHKDLKLMHGRLARAEGSKPNFEATSDEQTTFRARSLGSHKNAKGTKQKARRCVIS